MARRTGDKKAIRKAEQAQIRLRQQVFFVCSGQPLSQALLTLGLEPERFLAVRNGQMLPIDGVLAAGDEVQLVAIVAGGCLR